MALTSVEIAEVFEGFRAGLSEPTAVVRGWVEVVVRSGNWRFDDAESVAQDALIKLYKLAQTDKVRDPGAFQKLAYTVAKGTCVDAYYKDRRRDHREGRDMETVAEPEANTDFDRKFVDRDRAAALTYIIQRLPEACRELWRLVYAEGLSAKDVGEKLGINAGNVRVRVHRCLEKARAIYADLEGRTLAFGSKRRGDS